MKPKNLEVIEYFFKDNEARFSKETVRSYRITLNQFFIDCDKEYDQVLKADVRAWLVKLDEAGLKTRTIRLKFAALKTFYKYCLEEEFVNKNPTYKIEAPQLEDSLPVYLDKAALAELRELSRNNRRDRAVIETLYATGVRASEMLNIKLEDIKWDTRQIWIKKGKGTKERFVLFTTECAARLKDYLDNRNIDNPYLFANNRGGHLSRVWLEFMFKGYSEQLKLEFKVTPHTMRHTFAAHLAEKGMPQTHIQELLGHTNINTTRIYTRLGAKARKKQYDSYQL